jgi:hypothetical protein
MAAMPCFAFAKDSPYGECPLVFAGVLSAHPTMKARVKIENCREIQLGAAVDHELGSCRDPALVRSRGDELPIKDTGAQPIATSVTLTLMPNPAPIGQPVMFTATITPASGTPTGIVGFLSDGGLIGTATVTSAGGIHTASIATSALSRGAHVVSVLYIGGAGFASNNSLPAVHAIQ